MKTIVVPTDFSEYAAHALNFAIDFNRKVKGKILLVHVLEFPLSLFSITEEANRKAMEVFYTSEHIDKINEKLDNLADLVKRMDQEVETLLKYGNPYQKISGTVAEVQADWIVMGSKGASGLKEVLLGSNAERMVRYAKCPVFVVKDETWTEEMKNIVFGTDLSEEQDKIAEKVKNIQEIMGLPIHIVKVKTPMTFLVGDRVETELEDFVARNNFKDYTTHEIEANFLDLGLIEFAESVDAGLITMGTHGKTGLNHLFTGSRAESVVNESNIPMLIFKI